MTALDLPVVDFRDHGSASHADFVVSLGQSLERYGFVAVTHHGIEAELLDRAYDRARAFFALPDAVKRTYEHPATGRQRGYTGYGVERAKDTPVADLKEFWMVGRNLPHRHPLVTSGTLLSNIRPDVPEGFADALDALFLSMDRFANAILGAIAQHLGLDEHALIQACADGNSALRVIRYPPIPGDADPRAVRAAAHEDINLLTVLPASTQPGLELLDRSTGTWRAVMTPPDVVICDTGDIMQRLSSGRLPATTHRVVNVPGAEREERMSMPFFVHPRPDWVIEAIDGDAPPISALDFLHERLRANGVLAP